MRAEFDGYRGKWRHSCGGWMKLSIIYSGNPNNKIMMKAWICEECGGTSINLPNFRLS